MQSRSDMGAQLSPLCLLRVELIPVVQNGSYPIVGSGREEKD